MNNSGRPLVLVLPGSEGGNDLVFACAHAIAGDLGAALHCICSAGTAPALPEGVTCSMADTMESVAEQMRLRAGGGEVKMVVSAWPSSRERLRRLLRMIKSHNVPAVVVRGGCSGPRPKGALLLAGGGPHLIQHFWAAQEICGRLELSPRLLCIESHEAERDGAAARRPCASEAGAAKVVGIDAPVELCRYRDVVEGVMQRVREDDVIMLGGPNYTRLGEYFDGSIPDIISRKLPNDLIMMLGRKPPVFDLSDIFWDEVICMDMEPGGRDEAIAILVDKLIENKQIPAEWRGCVLETALAREAILPTVTDAETAFPHVTIPGLAGIIGALGICPGGVNFGGPSLPARFIFLLLTPKRHYDDYLGVLSDVATIMMSPERRRILLEKRSQTEVLEQLEEYRRELCR